MRRILLSLLFMASASLWSDEFLAPSDNLIVEGISPINKRDLDSVDRYGEFRSAAISDWHPQRREILITTRFADTPQIHSLKFAGGARSQLTFFKDSAVQPTFEPKKGQYFVFEKDSGGSEVYQLYRFDIATGDIALLTDGKSRHTANAWAPGGGMAYTNLWANHQTLFAYGKIRPVKDGVVTEFHVMDPAQPASDRMVAEHPGAAMISSWSPDDKKLLVMEFFSIEKSNLWLIDVETGKKEPVTQQDPTRSTFFAGGRISKDGKGIYTVTDQNSDYRTLSYLELSTGKLTKISESATWDVEEIAFSPGQDAIAYATNENGIGVLKTVNLKKKVITKVAGVPIGVLGRLRWHSNGRDLGFSLSNAQSPSDVYSYDMKKRAFTRWTTSETGGIDASQFQTPRLVTWKGSDAKSISGYFYQAPAKFTGPRPVVIVIHGGPESQYRPGFLGKNNYLLNELGVSLLYPNVRGSSGFGRQFVALDNGKKREDSYQDILALLDWIATQKELDPSRVMVTGGSYGGHMTLAIASRYSDRIRCALSVVGMSNLRTFLENTESYRRDLRRAEYGDERDPATRAWMDQIAPLNNTKQITKPLFVVQGFNDPRVPKSEAIQMVEALKKQKTPVWFLMAKDEGHGFSRKKNQDYLFYSTLAFVKEYLLPSS